jgi:hypothetical protein
MTSPEGSVKEGNSDAIVCCFLRYNAVEDLAGIDKRVALMEDLESS